MAEQNELKITIVPDEACPGCGAYWKSPNLDSGDPLDFPNRIKVTDEQGDWWRCYNPHCTVAYYNPTANLIEREG
jgi:hypothetical protein